MSDWADEKAQEWLDKHDPDIWHHRYSLADLLREVALEQSARARKFMLAEVRRVVEKVDNEHDGADAWCFARDKILARLEKL